MACGKMLKSYGFGEKSTLVPDPDLAGAQIEDRRGTVAAGDSPESSSSPEREVGSGRSGTCRRTERSGAAGGAALTGVGAMTRSNSSVVGRRRAVAKMAGA